MNLELKCFATIVTTNDNIVYERCLGGLRQLLKFNSLYLSKTCLGFSLSCLFSLVQQM